MRKERNFKRRSDRLYLEAYESLGECTSEHISEIGSNSTEKGGDEVFEVQREIEEGRLYFSNSVWLLKMKSSCFSASPKSLASLAKSSFLNIVDEAVRALESNSLSFFLIFPFLPQQSTSSTTLELPTEMITTKSNSSLP